MTKYLFTITFFLLAIVVAAQNHTKDGNEIHRLEQIIVKAILNGDTNMLEQVWAPEFIVNNPRNNVTVSRDSVLQIQKAGLINYSDFTRIIEKIQFQKGLAIVMGREAFVSQNDTPGVKAGITYNRRFTNIWIKKKGKWIQIGRHASIICQ
jgi:hypothetical protein